jgi:signal peptidase I
MEKRAPAKGFWSRLWWFLWEDNSVWSWIANIVLAFVLIKFIIYPALGLLLGTGYPIVAVVSGSMEHDGSFEEWWARPQCCNDAACAQRLPQGDLYARVGMTPEDFKGYPFSNGFNKGDIMILRGPQELTIGDILVFWADSRAEPIIHRVVQVKQGADGGMTYRTKGDHNCGSASFEQAIGGDRMLGKALFRVPYLGWIKIGFVELLKAIGVA